MSEFDNIIRALSNIPQCISDSAEKGLSDAALLVAKTAKEKLGTYQPAVGEFPAWQKLKPESVRRKYLSKSGSYRVENGRRLTRAGQRYLREHGNWGAGGNADAPLVDTGHLRQAITTDLSHISEGVAYIGVASGSAERRGGAPGNYAAAHEFGYAAKNIPPRPFLRPAVYENQEAIKDIIAETIRDGVRDTWR